MVIHTKRKDLPLGTKTLLMGILNVTPDSFSDGGKFFGLETALSHARLMIAEGADILDIGGESSRPGAEAVSEEEELKRIVPVLKAIREEDKDIVLSVDTYKAEVARQALEAGADIINDVSGFQLDSRMPEIAAEFGCPMIINHVKGDFKTMQKGEIVYTDVVEEISDFFTHQIALGETKGMKREQFILDVGFGFGKRVEHNLELIKRLAEFQTFNLPLMIGVSRKSSFGKLLQEKLGTKEPVGVEERLEASLGATAIAVWNGAQIVRTHDVLATRKCVTVIDAIKQI